MDLLFHKTKPMPLRVISVCVCVCVCVEYDTLSHTLILHSPNHHAILISYFMSQTRRS